MKNKNFIPVTADDIIVYTWLLCYAECQDVTDPPRIRLLLKYFKMYIQIKHFGKKVCYDKKDDKFVIMLFGKPSHIIF